MANFLEDPRLRQRWNQISHNAETVTENAAAGIWTFQHRYINPCLASLGDAVDPCIAPCLGDRDERARRARAREHHAGHASRAEYTFDFYDDWDDDDELLASGGGGSGILGGWGGAGGGGSHGGGGAGSRGEDWDRLIGGSGAARKHHHHHHHHHHSAEVTDQPKRKRGMSYGTRGARRKTGSSGVEAGADDPTIIPSTAPLGFLGRLPWKIGGTLRYKPSAAFLQDHPGGGPTAHPDENQPLLVDSDSDADVDVHPQVTAQMRKRSGTGGSGDTSDSFRSRGDLFPSDGEEYEDAMEIDDEFAVALERVDDRASSNTRSSKGKRPAGRRISRTVSATTLSTSTSKSSLAARRSSAEPGQNLEDSIHSILAPSMEDLQREDEEAGRLEDQEVARKREAAAQLARERGLSVGESNYDTGEDESRAKSAIFSVEELSEPSSPQKATADECVEQEVKPMAHHESKEEECKEHILQGGDGASIPPHLDEEFVPARLPNFR